MLSGETAKGSYPQEAVTVMAAVCKEAEAALFYKAMAADIDATTPAPLDVNESVANACVNAATYHEATAIITLTEQLVRALHGGRVTSCKSAKDRTSMAVTAEQVRWLVERHGLDADEAPALVDEMRSRGCRWQNMRKNVSKGTYAFNWIQQRLLPEIYRAPKGTYRQWGGTPT